MTAGINITMIPNAAFLAGRLNRYAGEIRSARDPLEQAVDEIIRPRIRSNFEDQEAAGIAWEELSEHTPFFPYRRRSSNPDGPTLDVTGKLKRVAQQKNIWNFQGQQGTAFVSELPGAEYGFFHEVGFISHLTGTQVPAREFLVIPEEDIDAIEEIFEEWLARRQVHYRLGVL